MNEKFAGSNIVDLQPSQFEMSKELLRKESNL